MSRIDFIIPTYNRPEKIMVIIASLVCQTNNNWTAHIVIDGETNDYDKVKEIYQNHPQIRFTHLDKRYNDWGHTPRQYGLDNSTEEWVCMTGDDNYYVPVFVDEMLKVSDGTHFVYCNMVHNWVNNDYIPLDSEPKTYRIDIGNFIVRTRYGKDIRLQVDKNEADGLYVEEFLRTFRGIKPKKINKVLYIHN